MRGFFYGAIPEVRTVKMRYTTFRYNVETCQYERVGMNAWSILWYCLGLATMAVCMLVGILLLHDLVVNTETETRLRKENRALSRHHALLETQLDELEPVLTSLEQKDRVLHAKFFGSLPPLTTAGLDRASKQELLLADADSFRNQISSLTNSSNKLVVKASQSNQYFSKRLTIGKNTLSEINSLPTLQPIQPWVSDRLISGFGQRVNPFHKGLYHHLGVDIAMPRGTSVISTAGGVVVQLKRSDLQAGYGNYVEIDHGNGLVTRYAHLEDIKARFGAKIKKGETIGTVGTSGGSVAPHLHYEILRDGKNVDPVYYMVEALNPSQHHFLQLMSHQQNQSLD
jgi:murein DD-endopeptidase MepM/ murein hydrolase activator NlpD